MASFFEDLWNSIFTPGPTPPLLIATNVAFAALQLVLFICLISTFSIHFFIMSSLSGGLWFAINWFANEVQIAQAKEEEEKRKRSSQSRDRGPSSDGNAAEDEMNSGEDTETELEESRTQLRPAKAPPHRQSGTAGGVVGGERLGEVLGSGSGSNGTSTSLGPGGDGEALRKRKSLGESTGDLSTDSEWEKVDEDER